MADKFLKTGTNGLPTEQEFTVVSTGVSEAGQPVALGSDGLLDESVLPTGIGQNMDVIPASENLSAGDFVNLWLDSGTTKVRKADASNGRLADGFVRAAVTAPANANVFGPGELNDQLTGLTGGTAYFLSTTSAGDVQTAVPTGANETVQPLGVAKSSTAIRFNPGTPIVRA